jgi:molybdopterin-guanine dinucleotide biosynthesis protein A
MAVTAVILAGGQGRRMGGMNKALLTFGDETFIERQLQVAKEVSDEIIIVANDREISTLFQNESTVRVIPDIFIGEGPLAGLHAGLAAASNSVIWLLGCDQPFLNAAAAHLLHNRMASGNYQAALPFIGGRPQPLHAVYRKEVGDIVESLLISGERRFIALLDHIAWYGIEEQEFIEHGISLRFADDIDTPEQYDQLRLKEQLP